jgi:polyisoprenoid-binding protein YceI
MSKKVLIGISAVFVLAVAAIATYVLRPTAAASAPIEAVPVEVEQPKAEMDPEVEVDSSESSTEPQQSEEISGETEVADEVQPGGVVVFVILQDQSEVLFTLDEILRGNPTTVVGATNQVAGEIAIDIDNPANSQVGTILVNARTLATDNDFRNRAIKNEILDTGDYEFITFTPIAISGFPDNPKIGEEVAFTITGDLTIRDITHEVTFDAKVIVDSETQLSGYASTMVARADYELNIPDVPSVADVDEEVLLEIVFVAVAN